VLQLFIKSKETPEDAGEDPINAATLRHEFKAAPVTKGSDNLLHIDPAVKSSSKVQRVHSRVYTGTVHASLKFLPNRNWYPGVRQCCLSTFACVLCHI
jgi:hypothetical protein